MAKPKGIYPIPPKISDAAFIADPKRWPKWPMLPVKRGINDNPNCGIVWADAEPIVKPTVYACNMWHLPKTKEEFNKTKYKTYESIAAMLSDGWVVD